MQNLKVETDLLCSYFQLYEKWIVQTQVNCIAERLQLCVDSTNINVIDYNKCFPDKLIVVMFKLSKTKQLTETEAMTFTL